MLRVQSIDKVPTDPKIAQDDPNNAKPFPQLCQGYMNMVQIVASTTLIRKDLLPRGCALVSLHHSFCEVGAYVLLWWQCHPLDWLVLKPFFRPIDGRGECQILLHAPGHRCGFQPLKCIECKAGSILILQ